MINPAMMSAFKSIGKLALSMNHYELNAAEPTFSVEDWKDFLQEREVQEFIKAEMDIIREKEVNRLVATSGNSRSVGQAQMISALTKLEEDKPDATGPIFIFCHVPLNEQQEKAPNVKSDLSAFGFTTIPEG